MTESDQLTAQSIRSLLIFVSLFLSYYVYKQMLNAIQQSSTMVERLSQGRFDYNASIDTNDEFGKITNDLQQLKTKLSDTIRNIIAITHTISSASKQVNDTAHDLSKGANEQAAGIEETSAILEEMTASIQQNAENSRTTDHLANQSAVQAKEGGDAVKMTVEAMNTIAEKITVIEDIAYKTSLLALNAAIEAARAGEHGRGFEVVADEVRKLAERSQIAAKEIMDESTKSLSVAKIAGEQLDIIVPNIRKTAELVQEITSASTEQANGVVEVNKATDQLSLVSQHSASASEQLAATSQELTRLADELTCKLPFFKIDIA